ncbi:hypothetical protein ACVW1A_001205 [Bradyrhizobium sp. LB1.3]
MTDVFDGAGTGFGLRDRLGQRSAHPEPERYADRPDQKRHPPAIGVEHFRRHRPAQDDADERARGRGDLLARRLPCHHQRPMLGRGNLDQIGGGRPNLAAEGKALRHTRRDHDDGRGKTDRLIGRRERDGQDG